MKARPKHGWEQDSKLDALGLPDEDFDYDEFIAREFGGKPHRRTGVKWYWWATAVILLGLIILAGFSLFGWGHNAWR
ncbi:hypothetical protein [Luteolibacter marinus]|uniref:hypothetical protein n=1 Tax=Luteolibacter marinus TaxID=2776705 RepID=UPI001868F5C8|nr:hypothetical protein [Luteolibacter marinus]